MELNFFLPFDLHFACGSCHIALQCNLLTRFFDSGLLRSDIPRTASRIACSKICSYFGTFKSLLEFWKQSGQRRTGFPAKTSYIWGFLILDFISTGPCALHRPLQTLRQSGPQRNRHTGEGLRYMAINFFIPFDLHLASGNIHIALRCKLFTKLSHERFQSNCNRMPWLWGVWPVPLISLNGFVLKNTF